MERGNYVWPQGGIGGDSTAMGMRRRGGVTTNLTRRFVQFEIEVSKVLFIMSSDWVRNDNRRHVVL